MKREHQVLLGLSILIGGLVMVNKNRLGPSKYKEDDISLLLPAFQNKIRLLLSNMIAKGFDPILFDTGRTQKEADIYAAKGTGIRASLHLIGAATDIISGSKGWTWPLFFVVLAEESKKIHLTSGATFSNENKDPPHVQAIPVKYQTVFRKLKTSVERNVFIEKYYKSVDGYIIDPTGIV